ncbi:hypothetical protein Trydic_g11657 [Trypoxylus dichotomus]
MVRASETPSEFGKAVKVLKRQRVPIPPIHGARGVACTTEDKAEEPIRPTSSEEMKAIVKSFRPNKAPGPDAITYHALKHALKKFVMHMTNIYNAMLRLRRFPSQWKLTDVAMIPKPEQSHTWPQNYHLISLLPVMGKIIHRIIPTRLREETDDLNVIPGCQFGFRREYSTTHQVLRLVEHIKDSFNRRECTGAVFFDVAKAFDKAWHQGLLLKMHRHHLQGSGQAHSLLSPQEDLQSQAGRTPVHSEDGHSRRAARISDLNPAVQHLHQRHPDNSARQPGDVRGRCLHLFQVPQRPSDRPTSTDSTRHFAGLVRKVENRRPSPEKHGRAFRDRRSPKKEVPQRAGSHLLRRHHSLATRSQILGSHARFPGKLGSPYTPRARPWTSDVGNPLSDDDGTREARSLA